MMIYEENERAGNILVELLEAEKLEMNGSMDGIYTFTQQCGANYTITCC